MYLYNISSYHRNNENNNHIRYHETSSTSCIYLYISGSFYTNQNAFFFFWFSSFKKLYEYNEFKNAFGVSFCSKQKYLLRRVLFGELFAYNLDDHIMLLLYCIVWKKTYILIPIEPYADLQDQPLGQHSLIN